MDLKLHGKLVRYDSQVAEASARHVLFTAKPSGPSKTAFPDMGLVFTNGARTREKREKNERKTREEREKVVVLLRFAPLSHWRPQIGVCLNQILNIRRNKMTEANLNPTVDGYCGSIGRLVFKKYTGRTIVAKKPARSGQAGS